MTEVHSCSFYCDRPECIKAQRDELRDRLEQPEQKPVPWESFFNRYCPWLEQPEQKPVAVYGYCPQCGAKGVMRERRPNGNDKCANGHTYPSSTSTPPQRTWVDLTDEQIAEALGFGEHTTATTRAILTHAARAIEAKIKENT